ncbi:AMP-dependent synthetase [Rubrivivax gelatinosus]|uniref:AMP-binding protein n=1 Tax=Rubrivivax gelatinosus TaxID=28068 RepID=UPI001909016F|nr:AMP-binding protein [Rubrivivax gelatinosus]MBK1613642.1 AMP-dependent synthetase [Rubrivivax gelatinosus]
MNLALLLARVAAQDPERPAVLHGERLLWRYGQWAGRCARLAGGLRRLGLAPGERIALVLHNHPAYLELMWGAWWAGLAIVPINAKLHAREVAWIVGHSGARLCLVDADTGAGLDAGCPLLDIGDAGYQALFEAEPLPITARDGADLAWLFYTSGTTGRPKGVMLGHRQLLTMGLCYFADVDPIAPEDASTYAAPMSHGAGLYAVPHVIAGARHLVPASGGVDAAELFELARRCGPLSLFAAPTIVKRLVDHAQAHGLDGEGFKTIVYGGAPMYAADIERALQQLGPRFVQIYGQGESPMTISALSRRHLADAAHPRRAQRLASVGVAHSAVELRIADEAGRPLPASTPGEVLVRGDTVMAGYWQDAEASAATLQDGWLRTGDVGELDADGFLTLRDRSKDVIISGGSNIYPREVEEVLLRDPAVAEVSVIGAPDEQWGEVVVAFVVPRPDAACDPAALDALCRSRIARFKRPRHYRLLPQLPKNHYGKVLKTELRRLWAGGG